MRRPAPRAPRGAAITELALLAPVLVVILLWSMYLAELARVQLKVQEATRYMAWEMTAYTLDDYGQANHDHAFQLAHDQAVQEATDRYKDLDSIEDTTTGNMFMGWGGFTTEVVNEDIPAFETGIPGLGSASLPGPFQKALSALNDSSRFFYKRFGFNTKGQVTVSTTLRTDNRILPQHFLDEGGTGFFGSDVYGGRSLNNRPVNNRYTLVASGWDLTDGTNSRARAFGLGAPRAGLNFLGSPTGLYSQVRRMMHLGLTADLADFGPVGNVASFIANVIPMPLQSAYVVSNRYEHGGDDHGCRDFNTGAEGWAGMNNVKGASKLDANQRACFDTSPFRDTVVLGDSLYRQMFRARGEYFMGCMNPMADDPTVPGPPPNSDKESNNKKMDCESPRP
ncbi:MAG: pilus assembly protein [Myxococcaceae bacterium]|nr:pilus assembly protein [Myxococcaceae bacterium]